MSAAKGSERQRIAEQCQTDDPFGTRATAGLVSGSTFETKTFLGQYWDADAELQHLNARYYDPALGLFVSPD